MTTYSIKRIAVLGSVLAGLALAPNSRAQQTVHSGWDLFVTVPEGTLFMNQNWHGVSLGTYDFGGSIGAQNVGATDTIIHRIDSATSSQSTIAIEMNALQMQSVSQFDLGAGFGFYYVTLQSTHGGTASTGNMNISFDPVGGMDGSFSSSLDVYFDIRFGAVNGPIVNSDHLSLSSAGTLWSHLAPSGAEPLIPGVNFQLDGLDTFQDFWPMEILEQHEGGGAQHTVVPSPEPGPGALLLFGTGVLWWFQAKARARKA